MLLQTTVCKTSPAVPEQKLTLLSLNLTLLSLSSLWCTTCSTESFSFQALGPGVTGGVTACLLCTGRYTASIPKQTEKEAFMSRTFDIVPGQSPCKIRRLPLDCYCNSGGTSQF